MRVLFEKAIYGPRVIFHQRLQCQFQKLLCCHRGEIIAIWLHSAMAKFADRKLPEYSEFSVFLQLFRKCCTASTRHATHRNLYVRRQEIALSSRLKNCTCNHCFTGHVKKIFSSKACARFSFVFPVKVHLNKNIVTVKIIMEIDPFNPLKAASVIECIIECCNIF